MPLNKKYIITSITLGTIAASSAVLIGLANLLTKDKIAQNEREKVLNGIVEIFGEGTEIASEGAVSYGKYINYQYDVNGGYAFKATGSNTYGKITILVGFSNANGNYAYKGLTMIVDEQTYASTLEDNYIAQVSHTDDFDSVDVKCGATYGATLVSDMVHEAKEFIESWKND